jgi:tripartite-type tricarboxylate transporter receptor subunit TctC
VAGSIALRLVARCIAMYQQPDVLVQNSQAVTTAANYVWGVAKPDETTLLPPSIYIRASCRDRKSTFDIVKFHWISSLENDDMIMFARADAPYKSMSEIVRTKTTPKCGSTGVGSSDYVLSKILIETIGARIDHVMGYPGSSEIALALERGEIMCMGLTIWTYFSREPFLIWKKTNFVNYLAQSGSKRDPRLSDTPTVYELMDEFKTSPTKRRVAEAMNKSGQWARPLMAHPGTPADRVAVLRAAYEKVSKDPEVLAEATKLRIEIKPNRGEQLQSMIKEVMDQPSEVIEQIKKLFVQ